jgi:polyisoprenoid-binding protein YceI
MNWQIDLAHSSVGFSTKHMMLTTVRGSLPIVDARLEFDAEHPERGSVAVTLDASGIDTGFEARDNHLRSPDFLGTDEHPRITFSSTRVEPVGGSHYRIHGELSIRGVTRPVVLDARLDGVVPDPRGGRRAAFSASTRINREDWGLGWNVALEQGGWLVGKEILVEIDVAAVEPAVAMTDAVASAA